MQFENTVFCWLFLCPQSPGSEMEFSDWLQMPSPPPHFVTRCVLIQKATFQAIKFQYSLMLLGYGA